MSAAIQAAIAKSKEVAAASEATQVAEVHQFPVANSAPVPASKLTMASMPGSSMSVDMWIKVKEDGLKLGDNPGLIESLLVSIDMTDGRGFTPKLGIKAGTGGSTTYFYTTDGVNAIGGGSWANAVQKAVHIQSNAREYRCVDLPFRLEEDWAPKGKPPVKAGTSLGYTTSTTNWGNWEKFYQEVAAANLLGQRVSVRIGSEPRTNKNGNNWGVMTFELLGLLDEEGDE